MIRLRFKLNHAIQGQNAPFLLAEEAGHFAREGLAVEFIEGFSSSLVFQALAAGEAELGLGDASSVLEAALAAGRAGIAAVMPIHVRSPCSLGYLRRGAPLRLADLDGAVLCAPPGDTSARLLPLLLARAGLPGLRYELRTVPPAERDRMIATGEALAATCFDATLVFSMRAAGHDTAALDFLAFADHGLDTYASALIAARSVLAAHPGLADRLRRAVRAAWDQARADPAAAVAAALRRAPGLDPGVVAAQLEWVLDRNVFPATRPPFVFEQASERMRLTRLVAQFNTDGGLTASPALDRLAGQVFA